MWVAFEFEGTSFQVDKRPLFLPTGDSPPSSHQHASPPWLVYQHSGCVNLPCSCGTLPSNLFFFSPLRRCPKGPWRHPVPFHDKLMEQFQRVKDYEHLFLEAHTWAPADCGDPFQLLKTLSSINQRSYMFRLTRFFAKRSVFDPLPC